MRGRLRVGEPAWPVALVSASPADSSWHYPQCCLINGCLRDSGLDCSAYRYFSLRCSSRAYPRYALSYRDAEELLTERGIDVDYVTAYR